MIYGSMLSGNLILFLEVVKINVWAKFGLKNQRYDQKDHWKEKPKKRREKNRKAYCLSQSSRRY